MKKEETNSVASVENFGYKQELKRSLGLGGILVFGLAVMSPLAPAAVFGYVAQESYGLVPLVYFIGIAGMVFTALGYAQMGRRFPIAGSVYNYVQRGLNPHLGFLAGWLIMIDYFLIPSACMSLTGNWMSSLVPGIPAWVWILASIIIFTFANIRGIEDATKLNFALVGFQMLLFIIFIFCVVRFLINGGGMGFSIQPFYKAGIIDFKFVATAATLACFSFIGFDSVSTLGEEAKKPSRDIPRATILCLLILGAMFITMTWLAACVVPNYTTLDPDMGFFDICGIVGGTPLRLCMILALIMSNIICSMSTQASVTRIMYSFSRDKFFPKFFGVIHPKYKSPWLAILFCGIMTAILSIFVNTTNLLTLVNFGALSAYLFLNFTVFWYFFIKEKRRGIHGIINYLIVPFIGFSILAFIWMGFDKITLTFGFAWLFIGIVWGAIKSKGYKEVPEAFSKTSI